MAIRCEHVHRLELWKFGLLWQRSKCADSPIYHLFLCFLFACPKLNFVIISRLTGKRATQNFKTYAISSLWTCSHLMAILRRQNKNTIF